MRGGACVAKIERLPSERGPNSMRPGTSHDFSWPSASAVASIMAASGNSS